MRGCFAAIELEGANKADQVIEEPWAGHAPCDDESAMVAIAVEEVAKQRKEY